MLRPWGRRMLCPCNGQVTEGVHTRESHSLISLCQDNHSCNYREQTGGLQEWKDDREGGKMVVWTRIELVKMRLNSQS